MKNLFRRSALVLALLFAAVFLVLWLPLPSLDPPSSDAEVLATFNARTEAHFARAGDVVEMEPRLTTTL